MSLIHPQEMTEANLAAHRANGQKTQGPVTPEGKANSAAANLRHGFYCKVQNGALAALKEDPQEYAGLMDSLENNLVEGLECQLVELIADTVWRMKRAKRMQDGLALNHIQAAMESQDARVLPHRLLAHENLDYYDDLTFALDRRGNSPTPAEIHTFVEHFKDDPSEEMKEFFLLLKSLNKLEKGPERNAARRKARVQLQALIESYQRVCLRVEEHFDELRSPESLAALIAPRDENALLLQRMEDSSLRKLWRLTNMLFRVRNGGLTLRDVKNEDRPGYVHENKDDDDKMSGEKHGSYTKMHPLRDNRHQSVGFLAENA